MTFDQLKPNQMQHGLDFPEPVEVHAQRKPAPKLAIHGVHSALTEKSRAAFVMANRTRNAHSCSMKIIENVRKYTAEQDCTEEGALKMGNGGEVPPVHREGKRALRQGVTAAQSNP